MKLFNAAKIVQKNKPSSLARIVTQKVRRRCNAVKIAQKNKPSSVARIVARKKGLPSGARTVGTMSHKKYRPHRRPAPLRLRPAPLQPQLLEARQSALPSVRAAVRRSPRRCGALSSPVWEPI
jgi:hypothetical protein